VIPSCFSRRNVESTAAALPIPWKDFGVNAQSDGKTDVFYRQAKKQKIAVLSQISLQAQRLMKCECL
jgi:hypothetical protein